MWPFRSDKPDDSWVSKAVPVTTLARWYMYDLDVTDANKLAVALNLTPVSEEGDEKERQDADVRIRRLESITPFMSTMAEINSRAVFQVQRNELSEELREHLRGSGPELDQLIKFYERMSFAAILSSFSSAAELGLIQIAGKFTSKEVGESYE